MTSSHFYQLYAIHHFDMTSNDRKTLDNVIVTPETAGHWLTTVNTKNRNFKPRAVEQYANDMKSGKWTPSRIIFYQDGVLCDGQNRLAAVVQSGVPVAFDILVGASYDEGVNIDMGVKRKQGDSLKLQGAEHWITTNGTIAIINYIIRMSEGNATMLSHNEIKQYAENNQEWIKPMAQFTIKKKNLTTAAYFASACLALRAGESLSEITDFHQAYVTGEVFDRNKNAVIKLREYCLENKHCWTGKHACDTGKLVQRAIKAYIERQPLQKLYVPSNWIYPLPKINNQ
jgi:hypothetical protein